MMLATSLRDLVSCKAVMPGGTRRVRLLTSPVAMPQTPAERVVVATLESAGPLAFDTLLSRAVEALSRDEWRRGLWATDIGMLVPDLFSLEVARVLEAGNGRFWMIDAEGTKTGPTAAARMTRAT